MINKYLGVILTLIVLGGLFLLEKVFKLRLKSKKSKYIKRVYLLICVVIAVVTFLLGYEVSPANPILFTVTITSIFVSYRW